MHRLEVEEESNFDKDTEQRKSEKVRDRVDDIPAFRYPSLAHNGVPEARATVPSPRTVAG